MLPEVLEFITFVIFTLINNDIYLFKCSHCVSSNQLRYYIINFIYISLAFISQKMDFDILKTIMFIPIATHDKGSNE
ncbi:hypothetical protein A6767_07685 [Aeromonas veronii]|nr:hypothetical protein A6767_07685 [Aeromonas veronii]